MSRTVLERLYFGARSLGVAALTTAVVVFGGIWLLFILGLIDNPMELSAGVVTFFTLWGWKRVFALVFGGLVAFIFFQDLPMPGGRSQSGGGGGGDS